MRLAAAFARGEDGLSSGSDPSEGGFRTVCRNPDGFTQPRENDSIKMRERGSMLDLNGWSIEEFTEHQLPTEVL